MVVFSVLRVVQQNCLKSLQTPLLQKAALSQPKSLVNAVCVRHGHGKTMKLIPGRFQYTQWKDHMHFYILLAAVPAGLVITLTNVFVGPSELAEIPEGYDPKPWEYHKHPIKRFLAQHVYSNPEKEYEKTLHVINAQQERSKYKHLEMKIKHLMAERGDYKGWYYIPTQERNVYRAREYHEEFFDSHGKN